MICEVDRSHPWRHEYPPSGLWIPGTDLHVSLCSGVVNAASWPGLNIQDWRFQNYAEWLLVVHLSYEHSCPPSIGWWFRWLVGHSFPWSSILPQLLSEHFLNSESNNHCFPSISWASFNSSPTYLFLSVTNAPRLTVVCPRTHGLDEHVLQVLHSAQVASTPGYDVILSGYDVLRSLKLYLCLFCRPNETSSLAKKTKLKSR